MKKIINSMLMLAMAAMTFVSCEDVPEPYSWPTPPESGNEEEVITPQGSGTLEDPYNVAAAQALIQTLGADVQSEEIYVKGFISQIDDISPVPETTYGNATYWISDQKGSTAGQLEIYRGYSLGGEKFTSKDEIKEDDEVIIKGKVVNFRGSTPEFTTGSSIYSLNGKTAGDKPQSETIGTLDEPITVSKAVELINALEEGGSTEQEAYIKGKITTIKTKDEDISKYKNIDYIISDGTNELTVFRGKNLNNTDFTEAGQINVGDEVVVIGKLTKFVDKNGKMIPEVAQGNYIVKLTKGGGGTPGTEAKTVTVAEFNAASESNDVWYQLTGVVKNLKDDDIYGNFDLEDQTGSVYVYGLLSEKGGEKKKFQELAAAKGIKNGSTITIIGNRGSYKDKIEVMNAYFVSIDDGNGGGGETTGTGTLENPLTATQAYDAVAAMEKGAVSEADYYVKGKISSIKYTFSAEYGTATFNISDDGTDSGKQFIAYSCYYFGNKKWEEGNKQVNVGDEVIVCGKVVNYNGNTPEFASKKNYLVSLNGSSSSKRR
jgi:RPA family protein